jgi:hypothetical protein
MEIWRLFPEPRSRSALSARPFVAAGGQCAEHQSVTVLFQWVCPGAEGVNSNICPGVGLCGQPVGQRQARVLRRRHPDQWQFAGSSCGAMSARLLIGSAISDQPNFDGLIGNAVIRGPNLGAGPDAGSSTAVSA